MSKQPATKRKAAASTAKAAIQQTTKTSKATSKPPVESSAEEEDEGDGIAETQFDEDSAPRKATKPVKKGTKVTDDTEGFTPREKRLQAKLDIVSTSSR